MRKPAILISGALLLSSALHAGDFLLTDNERPGWQSNTFGANEPRLNTGATLSPVTEGESACSPEFVKTAAAPNGTFRALLDGRRGPEGDCQGFGSWMPKTRFESFVIDLKKTVRPDPGRGLGAVQPEPEEWRRGDSGRNGR